MRSVHSTELGEALARVLDEHIAIELANASHATKVIDDSDQYDGVWLSNDKFKLDPAEALASSTVAEQASALAEAIYQARTIIKERQIPRDLMCALRPAEYDALIKAIQSNGFSTVNRDYSGNNGDWAMGTINEIGGVKLIENPNIPSADTGSTGLYQYHNRDCSNLIGNVFCKDAIGVLRLMGLKIETDYRPNYQGTFAYATMAVGMGTLRPECSINLELDTLTNA